ncbi:MAG: hypothetical protein OXG24_03075 [Gammaproteobacteria bacterium]|nr:hypothetical protein [Gammaproteobacteria bacterium]
MKLKILDYMYKPKQERKSPRKRMFFSFSKSDMRLGFSPPNVILNANALLWTCVGISCLTVLCPYRVLASETGTDHSSAVESSNSSESIESQSFNLGQIGDLSSRFERQLALYQHLQNVSEKDLTDSFQRLQHLEPNSIRFEAESLFLQKWATLDPPAALAAVEGFPEVRHRELLKLIFDEWFASDLATAIDHASHWSHHTKQMVFEVSILPRNDLDRRDKLEIASQFDIEYIANSLIEEAEESAPIVHAEAYWRSFSTSNRNVFADTNPLQLEKIARSLVEEMGPAAFSLVDETTPNVDDKVLILPLVAYQIADTYPQEAFQQVLDRTPRPREPDMLWGVVWNWAFSSPEEAFRAVSDIKSRKKRANLQASVLDVWAGDIDSRRLLALINEFPEEIQSESREKVLGVIANASPEDALKRTQDVQDATTRDRLENSIAAIWAESNLDAALGWVRSEPTVHHKRFQLMEGILGRLARNNLELAFETALAEPADESGVGLEASVIRGLVPISDEDYALALLKRTRNESTKLLGMLSIGTGFLQLGDEQSIDSAMNLSGHLESEEDRDHYWRGLILGWTVYGNEQELYHRLEQFPTAELKKHAAQMLITNKSDYLTNNQLKRLDSYIDDETN